MKPTTLYRFFDAYDRLLYVGISYHPLNRMTQHRDTKHWWTRIARVEMTHYEHRHHAKQAETEAIKTEIPLFNVAEVAQLPLWGAA